MPTSVCYCVASNNKTSGGKKLLQRKVRVINISWIDMFVAYYANMGLVECFEEFPFQLLSWIDIEVIFNQKVLEND